MHIESIPGVLEVQRFGDGPIRLLLEVPHGATERPHYDALAARLQGTLPRRLEQFFHVNTDFGAPEIALRAAEILVASARKARTRGVVVVRALVPRTFVDLNREIEGAVAAGMTSGLPSYITDERDRVLLLSLHLQYTDAVTRAYQEVMSAGGLGAAIHTYSPRSVDVAIDADIVTALRAAYHPGKYPSFPMRPPVDFITHDAEGRDLSPTATVDDLVARYAALGVEAGRNATYHMHPATLGYSFASTWPGRVLCVEYRRDLLGAPWRPFSPSPVGSRKVARLARPLAMALSAALDDGAGRTKPEPAR